MIILGGNGARHKAEVMITEVCDVSAQSCTLTESRVETGLALLLSRDED